MTLNGVGTVVLAVTLVVTAATVGGFAWLVWRAGNRSRDDDATARDAKARNRGKTTTGRR